jgi:hypothetical protein
VESRSSGVLDLASNAPSKSQNWRHDDANKMYARRSSVGGINRPSKRERCTLMKYLVKQESHGLRAGSGRDLGIPETIERFNDGGVDAANDDRSRRRWPAKVRLNVDSPT